MESIKNETKYKVLKFGGTSVANAYSNIKEIVLNELKENIKIILVLSALSGITNLLSIYQIQ